MNSHLKSVRNAVVLVSVAVFLLAVAGCRTPDVGAGVSEPPKANPLGGSSDLLRPGDVVIINFSGVSDPPARVDDRISQDGKITLPFLGQVQAAGKTRLQLQEQIQKLYIEKNYFKQLTVSVNADTRYFYVYGEVKKEGQYPYQAQTTVTKAIASAGGFTDFAKRTKVQLKRGNSKPVTIDCDDAQQDGDKDLAVYPDDTIFVPRRWF